MCCKSENHVCAQQCFRSVTFCFTFLKTCPLKVNLEDYATVIADILLSFSNDTTSVECGATPDAIRHCAVNEEVIRSSLDTRTRCARPKLNQLMDPLLPPQQSAVIHRFTRADALQDDEAAAYMSELLDLMEHQSNHGLE